MQSLHLHHRLVIDVELILLDLPYKHEHHDESDAETPLQYSPDSDSESDDAVVAVKQLSASNKLHEKSLLKNDANIRTATYSCDRLSPKSTPSHSLPMFKCVREGPGLQVPFFIICQCLRAIEQAKKRKCRGASRKLILKLISLCLPQLKSGWRAIYQFLQILLPSRCVIKYGIKETSIAMILTNSFGLSGSTAQSIKAWRTKNRNDHLQGDLSRILAKELAPYCNGSANLQVCDVMQSLSMIAAANPWNPRRGNSCDNTSHEACTSNQKLANLLHRLYIQCDVSMIQFLTRIIVKDLRLGINDKSVLNALHPRLYEISQLRSSLEDTARALAMIYESMEYGKNADVVMIEHLLTVLPSKMILSMLALKSTGIDDVVERMCSSTVLVETKYDGERYQLHVLSGALLEAAECSEVFGVWFPRIFDSNPIEWYRKSYYGSSKRIDNVAELYCMRVFSKSTRDSTEDRRDSLLQMAIALSKPLSEDGRLREMAISDCVLDGELLVYNELQECIEAFGGVRDFAPSYLQCRQFKKHKVASIRDTSKCIVHENDISNRSFPISYGDTDETVPRSNEKQRHFLVLLFDILELNGISLLQESIEKRKQMLTNIINCKTNWVDIVKHVVLDLQQPKDVSYLRKLFADSVAKNEEGLLIKKAGSKYVPGERRCWLKLKRDYIPGLGDTIEVGVVGWQYGERASGGHIGSFQCAVRDEETGCMRVLFEVSAVAIQNKLPDLNHRLQCLMTKVRTVTTRYGNTFRKYPSWLHNKGFVSDFVARDPDHLLVAEVLGSGFVNFGLRHPRIKRFRPDVAANELISWQEYQRIAIECSTAKSTHNVQALVTSSTRNTMKEEVSSNAALCQNDNTVFCRKFKRNCLSFDYVDPSLMQHERISDDYNEQSTSQLNSKTHGYLLDSKRRRSLTVLEASAKPSSGALLLAQMKRKHETSLLHQDSVCVSHCFC